jgi:hypothetical protein
MTKQELDMYRRYRRMGVEASFCILAAGALTFVSDNAACFFAGAASVSFIGLLREAYAILTLIERARRNQ